MATLWIDINLKVEGATAADALVLRNALEAAIKTASAGVVIGGGVSLNGSSCDLEVRCEDSGRTEALVRKILEEASLGHTVGFRTSGVR